MTDVTPFQQKVYDALCEVPKGKVTTYGELAKAVGINSSQAIGQALKKNPYAPQVPCHRVVTSDGKIGGFFGHRTGKEVQRKIELLESEGIRVENGVIRSFAAVRHSFPSRSNRT